MGAPQQWGPITPFTMFVAIRYAQHFNKRGISKPVAKRAADCHRTMAAIVDSMGGEAKGPGVKALNPQRRRLEEDRKAMADLVGAHCRGCQDFRSAACRGVTGSEVLYMPARDAGGRQ
jgi:hypothetical protein